MKSNSPRSIRSRLALNPKKVDRFDRFDANKNYENWIYLARGGTIICDPLLTNDQGASYWWSRSQNNFKMKVLITITAGAQDWSVPRWLDWDWTISRCSSSSSSPPPFSPSPRPRMTWTSGMLRDRRIWQTSPAWRWCVARLTWRSRSASTDLSMGSSSAKGL